MQLTQAILASTRLDKHPDFYWDIKSRRYRWRATQQFAPKVAVTALTERYLAEKQTAIAGLADLYDQGEISFDELQKQAAAELKAIHLAQAFLGRGGTEHMTPADFLEVARALKQQYYSGIDPDTGKRYGLKFLFQDLLSGNLSNSQLKDRLRKFGQSGRSIYWAMRRNAEMAKGRTMARRNLNSVHECPDCAAYAAMGFVSISRLVLPGQRCECKTNCKCTVAFV
jgi:hypothetical protein